MKDNKNYFINSRKIFSRRQSIWTFANRQFKDEETDGIKEGLPLNEDLMTNGNEVIGALAVSIEIASSFGQDFPNDEAPYYR